VIYSLKETTATVGGQKYGEGGEECQDQSRVLVTEAIEGGAQRVVREVLLPQTGREELDFQGGRGIDVTGKRSALLTESEESEA